jgi:hypothetical protein
VVVEDEVVVAGAGLVVDTVGLVVVVAGVVPPQPANTRATITIARLNEATAVIFRLNAMWLSPGRLVVVLADSERPLRTSESYGTRNDRAFTRRPPRHRTNSNTPATPVITMTNTR